MLEHVRRAIYSVPWVIQEEKLQAVIQVVERHLEGRAPDPEFVAADRRPMLELRDLATGAVAAGAGGAGAGGEAKVAILQLFGVVAQRMNMMDRVSGGTSTEEFAKAFDAVLNNPQIRAIVLQIDSPGGAVAGTPELADRIYAARDQKRIVALADSLAASAAYWIGSSASEFWATPSADVGSIGVFALHEDISKMAADAGVTFTIIKAGKYKAEGNPYEPLGDVARQAMQDRVDELYGMFTRTVARNRGVKTEDVRGGFGEGRALGAAAAQAAGMIDRIGTLDDVLVSLRAKPGPNARSRANFGLRQALLEEELAQDGT